MLRSRAVLRKWAAGLGGTIGVAVLLHPFYFVVLRLMVFNTVPRDDYAPFLLWLVGGPDGAFPVSPYGYRILTVAFAAPIYFLLPAFPLTNLPADISVAYVRATQAIAMLSFLSAAGASVLVYRLALDRCGSDRVGAVAAGGLLFVLCWYTAIYGIDSVTIFAITAGLYLLAWPSVFAVFILGSVPLNEKVALVLAIWLVIRVVFVPGDRRRFLGPMLASIMAVAVYGGLVSVLRLPGNEYQLAQSATLNTLIGNVRAYFSLRGLLLNVIPIFMLLGMTAWAWRHRPDAPVSGALFRPIDMLVVPALGLIALRFTELFQAGRIVLHAAPIFVVPIGVAFAVRIRLGARREDENNKPAIGEEQGGS